ncbi:MAG TPA: hypothetical protein VNM14_02380 [Planctomycetota bacterium]|jgi:hypothetical protein|nr:hypothetical protein [Planctomycetota bacterium]
MKALWTALVLLATPLTLLAQVSKEEVRRLLDAHVSEQTIISYVQRNGPMEVLSVEDLGDLKGAGASDSLLQALIQAQTSSSYRPPSTDSTPYTTEPSSTVIYDSPQYYYSYPSTAYPAYSYSYPAPYYYYSSYYPSYYPYRYSYYPYRYYPNYYNQNYYHGHTYPYRGGYSGYYGTHQHPTTVSTPRYPVQSGVNVYRQSPQPRTVAPQTVAPRTVAPRTVAPQPVAPRPQAPSMPRGGGGVPRR